MILVVPGAGKRDLAEVLKGLLPLRGDVSALLKSIRGRSREEATAPGSSEDGEEEQAIQERPTKVEL